MTIKKRKNIGQQGNAEDKKQVDSAFAHSVGDVKRHADILSNAKKQDLSGPVLKRRKHAALRTMETIRQRYQESCPHSRTDMCWAIHCAVCGDTVSDVERMYHITLAAALWMLDVLRENGVLEQALPYLPVVEETDDLPAFIEPAYDAQTIAGMIRLIQGRDGVEEKYRTYINLESVKREAEAEPAFPDAAPETLDGRQRFDAVMRMIPVSLREKAVRQFEEKYWAYADVLFACVEDHKKQMTAYHDRLVQRKKEFEDVIPRDQLSGPVMPRAVSTQFSPTPSTGDFSPEDKRRLDFGREVLGLFESCSKQEDYSAGALSRFYLLPMGGNCQHEDLLRELPEVDEEDRKKVQELSVDDPYEICFAYLLLIEQGSDLPWTYNPAIAVLLMAARQLPWTAFAGCSKPDEEAEASPEADDPADRQDKNAALYRLCYEDGSLYASGKSPAEDWKLNLPQLVYGSTGLLMPRADASRFADTLVENGIEPAQAVELARYVQLAREIYGRLSRTENVLREEAQERACPEETTDADRLQKELKEAREELKQMKQTAYEAVRAARASREEQERCAAAWEEDRQELADLREVVFHLGNGQDKSDGDGGEENFALPYKPRRRTAIFGGHDTWLKAIRPMLPGVTFVPRERVPDAKLIRSQDVIWLQPNALAHKDYYKLIDIIRTNHIPVRYFSFASARKCAVQLAEEDEQRE